MTDYIAPLHLAVVRHGKLAGNRDCAFWTEAVRMQLIDAAKAWGLQPPGVFLYDEHEFTLTGAQGAIISLVDSDGDPDALGYHSLIGDVAYGVVDVAQSAPDVSSVLSHEALELFGNAQIDRWAPGPDGLEYAVELCDPVEAQWYEQEVEVMGEKRTVMVSNFVYPDWFGLRNEWGHEDEQDHDAKLTERFEIAPGGYAIAEDAAGNIRYLAAEGGAMFPARKLRSTSRTARIISKGRR